MFAAPMVIMCLLWVTEALGFGVLGHEGVAEVVQGNLEPSAQQALAKILGTGATLPPHTLAQASIWPDQIRARKQYGTVPDEWSQSELHEADAFNAAHKKNDLWHFVNLPIAAPEYPSAKFERPDDIVHQINLCIEILERPDDTQGWTKAQAVRWLIHLVEDIHQPLHVTSGYYKSSASKLVAPKLIVDPDRADDPGVLGDRGGNGLLFGSAKENNLHALWDVCLVQKASGATSCNSARPTSAQIKAFSTKVASWVKASGAAAFKPIGDHHTWAAARTLSWSSRRCSIRSSSRRSMRH